jgi:hypothetical protein
MMVSLTRSGGSPPRYAENLSIEEDGSFVMHRQSGGSRVGTFAGDLQAEDLNRLRAEIEACAKAPASAPSDRYAPDEARDRITLGDKVVEVRLYKQLDGPFGPLLEHLQELLGGLTEFPRAALELTVKPTSVSARLRQVGEEAVPADLSRGRVYVRLVGKHSDTVDSWETALNGSPDGDLLVPGWEQDLGLEEAGFKLSNGRYYEVTVTCDLMLDVLPQPARLTSSNE